MKKAKPIRDGAGQIRGTALLPGPGGFYEQFTPEQMADPAANGIEIVDESITDRNVLRESFPEHTLGKGWVKAREARPMQSKITELDRKPLKLREDSQQQRFREATRQRIRAAYKVLGIAESDTSDAYTDSLIEAWGLLLGSREAGAAFVRGEGNKR